MQSTGLQRYVEDRCPVLTFVIHLTERPINVPLSRAHLSFHCHHLTTFKLLSSGSLPCLYNSPQTFRSNASHIHGLGPPYALAGRILLQPLRLLLLSRILKPFAESRPKRTYTMLTVYGMSTRAIAVSPSAFVDSQRCELRGALPTRCDVPLPSRYCARVNRTILYGNFRRGRQ